MLTQKRFMKVAGEQAVLWVAPGTVTRYRGSKWPVGKAKVRKLKRILPGEMARFLFRPVMKQLEPFITPADCFAKTVPIIGTERHVLVTDFLAHRGKEEDTIWYRQLCDELKKDGVARYKTRKMHTIDEIRSFLRDYVGGTADSLEKNGFDTSFGGYVSSAVVNADGSLCKTSSGNHRFVMAQTLGLERFPLRIVGAHEDWVRSEAIDGSSIPQILAALKKVEELHQ